MYVYLNPQLSTSPFHSLSLSLSHPSFCFPCQWMVMVFLAPMPPQLSLLTLVLHPLMSPSSFSFSFPLSHDQPSLQTLHSLSFSHAITIFIFLCIFPLQFLHGFQLHGLYHSPLIPLVLVCCSCFLLYSD